MMTRLELMVYTESSNNVSVMSVMVEPPGMSIRISVMVDICDIGLTSNLSHTEQRAYLRALAGAFKVGRIYLKGAFSCLVQVAWDIPQELRARRDDKVGRKFIEVLPERRLGSNKMFSNFDARIAEWRVEPLSFSASERLLTLSCGER